MYYGPGNTPPRNPQYRAEVTIIVLYSIILLFLDEKGFMLLYDVTDEDSFDHLENYLTDIECVSV